MSPATSHRRTQRLFADGYIERKETDLIKKAILADGVVSKSEAEFLIQVSAHEQTFSTRVMTRSSYLFDEVRWDVKFASIFASGPDGVLAIDVDRLDRTEPLAEGATSVPAALEMTPAAVR